MRDTRLERGMSVAVGLLGLLAMRARTGDPPPAPPPPRITTIRTPVPIPLVTPRIEPVLVPTAVAAFPATPMIDCPVPPGTDDAPIGRVATAEELAPPYDDRPPATRIAASSRAPVLALIGPDGVVRASTDDGRHFAPVFVDHTARAVAVDDRGRIYAAGEDGVGTRDLRGRETWRAEGCPHDVCTDRLVAIGDAVAWIRDDRILVSRRGDLAWRAVKDEDAGELARHEQIFAWDGLLYGVTYIHEQCDWDAEQVTSLDLATGELVENTFNDDDSARPRLDLVDDRGASWRYQPRGRLSRRAARNLAAEVLAPVTGARALRVENGALVEVCGLRARVVAHAFGGERIDAVDAAGRPLMARDDLVLRWSPRWGWRVLHASPPRDASGDGE